MAGGWAGEAGNRVLSGKEEQAAVQTQIPAMRFMRWERERATTVPSVSEGKTRSWSVGASSKSDGACDKRGRVGGQGSAVEEAGWGIAGRSRKGEGNRQKGRETGQGEGDTGYRELS